VDSEGNTVVNLTITSAPVGPAASITPGPGGHVLVTAWLTAQNATSDNCQVVADLLVDGVAMGGPALSTVPPGLPIIGGASAITIPLTAALTLSPTTAHTVQISARGFQQSAVASACGSAGRTHIVAVDLG